MLKIRYIVVIGIALLISVLAVGFQKKERGRRGGAAISYKTAHKLLMKLNTAVKGKRYNPNRLTKYDVGEFSTNSTNQDDGKQSEILKAECFADEQQFVQMESILIKEWVNSWLLQDINTFTNLLKVGAKVDSFFFQPGKPSNIYDNVVIYNWGQKKYSANITNDIKKYLASFKTIIDIDLQTQRIHIPMGSRNKNLSLKFIRAEMYIDIRGFVKSGKRRQDRGYLSVTFEKIKSHNIEKWQISKIKILKMVTLETGLPSFSEVTVQSKLDSVRSYTRLEAIRRGGYALSIIDYDNDGILDLLVGSYGPLQLYKGNKNGQYKEVINSGIFPYRYVKSAVFADFNNDGLKDLLLVRFASSKKIESQKYTDIIVYKNAGKGKFKKIKPFLEDSPTDYAMPAAVADFNNDGLLDFYVGYPGHKDFSSFGVNFDYKKKLKAQGVYINKGNFIFAPKKMSRNANYEKYSAMQRVFPHSAMAVDFNQDGFVDILVVDDRGNLSPLYENTGDGFFTQSNRNWNIENNDYGMGIASTDLNNDGLTDILMTNVRFQATERVVNNCIRGWDLGTSINLSNNRDLKMFLATKLGARKTFVESAKALGLNHLGDGLGGVEFLDYNNDGYVDIYITNGLWSGTQKYNDLSSHFGRLDFDDTAFSEVREEGTGSQIMNILSYYRGEIFGVKKSKERLSLGGFQRNRLFRNLGNGKFLEVGFLEGVDSIADGYIVSTGDLNNDGRIDLVLRNADPGTTDVNYRPVQVFKNYNANKNSLRVKLIGRGSNRDAIGAEVTLKTNSSLQTRQVIANLGTAQSNITLHFGLGKAKTVKSLVIKWPSGKVTKYKNTKPGFLVIKE